MALRLGRDRPCRQSVPRSGLCRQLHEAGDILRRDLHPQCGPKRVKAQEMEVLVEVAEPWRQRDRLDPSFLRPVDQRCRRAAAGPIVVV